MPDHDRLPVNTNRKYPTRLPWQNAPALHIISFATIIHTGYIWKSGRGPPENFMTGPGTYFLSFFQGVHLTGQIKLLYFSLKISVFIENYKQSVYENKRELA